MCLAVPGKVIAIEGDEPLRRSGRVSFAGVIKNVSLVCVPDAQVGDYVLVHVGVAIGLIDQKEAEETLGYLRQMDELGALRAPAEAAERQPAGVPLGSASKPNPGVHSLPDADAGRHPKGVR